MTSSILKNIILGTRIPIICIPFHLAYSLLTKKEDEICIVDKYMITIAGYSKLMIVTDKEQHFCVNNNLWFWKWDSIEDYHKLNITDTVEIKYYGYRYPLFGLFPNIYALKKEEGKSSFLNSCAEIAHVGTINIKHTLGQ